jgi:hypothetical protein
MLVEGSDWRKGTSHVPGQIPDLCSHCLTSLVELRARTLLRQHCYQCKRRYEFAECEAYEAVTYVFVRLLQLEVQIKRCNCQTFGLEKANAGHKTDFTNRLEASEYSRLLTWLAKTSERHRCTKRGFMCGLRVIWTKQASSPAQYAP